jgi:anthranilate phosphoribosyltransferase
MSEIRSAIARIVEGHTLGESEARDAMRSIVEGEATSAQIAAFATALRMRGEAVDEIVGLASVMREYSTAVESSDALVDVVGTGGDGACTINISTLAALVVVAAGGRVAKHGNRAVTSACGSADFLEGIGVAIDLQPRQVAESIRQSGFGFMFAPHYHPAMRHAVAPRREIGIRTVFNILGPLTNPAGAQRQLTGVAVPRLASLVAEALARLGSTRALVVHGGDGVDELSISGPSVVYEVHDGEVTSYQVEPAQFGLRNASVDAVRGGTVETNIGLAREILAGRPGPLRDMVVLNAGAALYAGELADSIRDGVARAQDLLDSGAVDSALSTIVRVSQELSAAQGERVP